MEPSHSRIINEITTSYSNGDRFAIWMLCNGTGLTPKTVDRILRILRQLRFVGKMPRGYRHKYWMVTKNWKETPVEDIIHKFEMYCIVTQETGL